MKNMINIKNKSSLEISQEKHKIQMTQYWVYICSNIYVLNI